MRALEKWGPSAFPVPDIHHSHGHTVTLSAFRFKVSALQAEDDFSPCYRGLELTPMRVGMVEG